MDPFGREVEEMETSSSPDGMEDPPTNPLKEPAIMDTLPPTFPLLPPHTAWPFHDKSHPRHHDSGHYGNTTQLLEPFSLSLEDGEDIHSPMDETF